MTYPEEERGWLRRNAKWLWTGLAITLVAAIGTCGLGAYQFVEGLKGMDDEPRHMAKSDIPAFEERYRDKGTVQQAVKDLETAIAKTADKITTLVPGLTWKWKDDIANVGCPHDPASDTRVTRFWVRTALFDGPIPEDKWPQAVAIVRGEAEFWGMTAQFKYQDVSRDHDLVFSSEDGGEISIASAVQALVTGKTPCRLMEDWYTDRGIPLPETHRAPR